MPVSEHNNHSPTTGDLGNTTNKPVEPTVQGTSTLKKEFTSEQELEFLRSFAKTKSIKKSLTEDMHVGYGDYQACASRLVQKMNLRG
jgi:hypothetical protein